MRTILFLAISLIANVLTAQVNMYDKPIPANPQSTFVPLTMEQMKLIAIGRAIEEANRKERFHQYVNKSNEYIKSKKWEYALEYIKRAEQTNFVSNLMYYNKGIAYFNLKKKGKLKKVIKKAKKHYYFEVVDLLTVKLNSL
ncbi:hypothetical protein [uncultured Lutibacter sp.]|uniref:hypothetical protein n=1 Tax=uncultured Lutibacter sp. TaxID=437739 RepID=UPI00261F512D|nr:hypothetical protein [uncultured Lutibacter sp.]